MVDTASRLLRLLTLLQTRPDWTGAALATALGVSARTVRNDIERLRTLGYPVWGTRGGAGGYRLGAGTALPPLLLADEEAVAVALGLHLAAASPVTGIGGASARALAKLGQVLPERLRHQVASLRTALSPADAADPAAGAAAGPGAGEAPSAIATETMLAIAAAIRERRTLRFDYRSHDGTRSRREAEPLQLIHTHHRWYLVAWDTQRAAWRTYRVDRLQPRVPPGPRFTPREPPPGGAAAFLDTSIHAGVMRFRALLRVHLAAEALTPRLPPAVHVTPETAQTSLVLAGAESPAALAAVLAELDFAFEVLGSPPLAAALAAIVARLQRAIAETPTAAT